MNHTELDELAGRIDGVARAVLHLTAALEMAGAIDGQRVAKAWRGSLPSQAEEALQASRGVLHEMADRLDAARIARAQRPATRSCSLVMVRENPTVSGRTQARASTRA